MIWQLGFIFGTIFRPECLIFNILLPFTHQLFIAKSERLKIFIQSISVPLVCFLFILILWIFFGFSSNINYFVRLNEIFVRSINFVTNILQPLEINTNNYYLRVLISDYSTSFKYFFLTYVAVYKWVAGLGFFHLFLFFYALKKQLISKFYFKLMCIFFIISSAITIVNLYTTYVIATRYWVMNFWIVYICSAIGFSHLWKALKENKEDKKIVIKRFLIITFLIYFFNVIIDAPGKHFEKQAGQWVKDNKIQLNNVFFSSKRAAYYAGYLAFDSPDFYTATNIIQYSYLMLTYDRFTEIKDIPKYQAIQYFPSKEDPKVIVYEKVISD